jgi:hypothetical protein
MTSMTDPIEQQLDSYDFKRRQEALKTLCRQSQNGKGGLPQVGTDVNLHAHTFYSYNAYGYSPSRYAWLARKHGMAVAGIVDFDVLDGVEEFLEAGRIAGLKTCASVESRVFVPEFATRVINSPGEPGIAYHMGIGFARAVRHSFLTEMRAAAEARTREILGKVNAYLRPVDLDYEKDVVPLTPKGNATERHLCDAFERKASKLFPDESRRNAFWKEKLGDAPPAGAKLQNLIRAKTMKKGGVGYAQPGEGSFPRMADMNRFVLECGGIPALCWLDGTSDGEKAMEELFAIGTASGAAALNLIPDRNYTPGVVDEKLKNLHHVIELAQKHHFPIIVGTEMNSPGNKFVDSFGTAELKPFVPIFLSGAHIVYAHTVLQRMAGMGYLSSWAQKSFASVADKNKFFEQLGRELQPGRENVLEALDSKATPSEILERLKL